MKKAYIKPEVVLVKLVSPLMVSVGSEPIGSGDIESGIEPGDEEDDY